jgi:uncharacterized protein (TIGR02996 family)
MTTSTTTMSTSDRRAELEAAIENHPNDRELYEVYGDELQRLGDPRGELISLQLADPTPEREAQARALIAAHDLAPGAPLCGVRWRWGFVSSAELDLVGAEPDLVRSALDHPSLRFVTSLSILHVETGLQVALDALASRPRLALRQLEVGGLRQGSDLDPLACDVGVLDALWPQLPELSKLVIRGQNLSLGTLALPRLKQLQLDSISLRSEALAAVLAEPWEDLWMLFLDFGHANPPTADLERLLAHPFPSLTCLWVGGNFIDELVEPLVRWQGLARLESLSLTDGLTDRGAAILVKHADAFSRLRTLDVSYNHLSARAIADVQGIAPEVLTEYQEEPIDRDPDLYDY